MHYNDRATKKMPLKRAVLWMAAADGHLRRSIFLADTLASTRRSALQLTIRRSPRLLCYLCDDALVHCNI